GDRSARHRSARHRSARHRSTRRHREIRHLIRLRAGARRIDNRERAVADRARDKRIRRMVRSLLRPPLLIALLAVAYLESSPALRARSDLDQYYRSPAHPSRYTESIAMLSSPSSFARQEAASYLTALYGYALEDERSGRIPWHETPYWGGPMESDAREFR